MLVLNFTTAPTVPISDFLAYLFCITPNIHTLKDFLWSLRFRIKTCSCNMPLCSFDVFAGFTDLQMSYVSVRTSSSSSNEILTDQVVARNVQFLSQSTSVNCFERNRNSQAVQSAIESVFETLCSVLACEFWCPTASQMHDLGVVIKLIACSSAEVLSKSICSVEISSLKLFTQLMTSIHHSNVSMLRKNLSTFLNIIWPL